MQRGAITEKLAHTEERLHHGAELVLAYVDMLASPAELYNRVPDNVRRDLLGAMFAELVVHVDDEGLRVDSHRTEVNAALHLWQAHQHLTNAAHTPDEKKRASRISAEGSSSVTNQSINLSKGLNILELVRSG